MNKEDLDRYKKVRAWKDSDIGKAFTRYENALANAWILDSDERASYLRIENAFKDATKRKHELLDLLGIEHPFG